MSSLVSSDKTSFWVFELDRNINLKSPTDVLGGVTAILEDLDDPSRIRVLWECAASQGTTSVDLFLYILRFACRKGLNGVVLWCGCMIDGGYEVDDDRLQDTLRLCLELAVLHSGLETLKFIHKAFKVKPEFFENSKHVKPIKLAFYNKKYDVLSYLQSFGVTGFHVRKCGDMMEYAVRNNDLEMVCFLRDTFGFGYNEVVTGTVTEP